MTATCRFFVGEEQAYLDLGVSEDSARPVVDWDIAKLD